MSFRTRYEEKSYATCIYANAQPLCIAADYGVQGFSRLLKR